MAIRLVRRNPRRFSPDPTPKSICQKRFTVTRAVKRMLRTDEPFAQGRADCSRALSWIAGECNERESHARLSRSAASYAPRRSKNAGRGCGISSITINVGRMSASKCGLLLFLSNASRLSALAAIRRARLAPTNAAVQFPRLRWRSVAGPESQQSFPANRRNASIANFIRVRAAAVHAHFVQRAFEAKLRPAACADASTYFLSSPNSRKKFALIEFQLLLLAR